MTVECCKHTKYNKKCIRAKDKKIFKLPRKFSKKSCKTMRGFTMRSSCAPYKYCNGGSNIKLNIAYFSGGCFWGLEEKFNKIEGVIHTDVGYMGGSEKNPTYKLVSSGKTNYVETLKIEYNNNIISYLELLKYFFRFHDKKYYDSRRNTIKKQYRSTIFYDSNNKQDIKNFINNKNIKTVFKLNKFKFYKAEEYHQKYYLRNKCNTKLLRTENIERFNKICINNTKKAEPKHYGIYNYLDSVNKGLFVCSCCGNKLYNKKYMYNSGSGWPSFTRSIYKNVKHNKETNELNCSNCGLHLGHRLYDGPTETKIHDCINSVCLYFVDKSKKFGGNNLSYKKNMNNEKIKFCSKNPMTGYYRDGYCMTGKEDKGTHTVCAKMDKKFLEYTKNKGNNLYSVVKPGDKWCLCEYRWNEAYKDNKAPKVDLRATNMRTKRNIQNNIRKHSRKNKKDFLYNPNNPKKSYDVYIDKNPKDTISIKFKTVEDVKNTIKKLEKLYKSDKYTHKRIWQVGMIMNVRLKVLKDKKPKQYKLSERYLRFLGDRTKIKYTSDRKKFKFNIY